MYRVISPTLPLHALDEDFTLLHGAEFTTDPAEATAIGELWVPLTSGQVERHIAAGHIERVR